MDSNNPKILAPIPSQCTPYSQDCRPPKFSRTFPTGRNSRNATVATTKMASSEEAIEAQLKKKGEKRDVDVKELYLTNSDLTEVCDLSRFRNLSMLWLNNNKLRRTNCLSQNYRLSELHLNHNRLVSIAGCLKHLTSLEKLMLHNNQLEKLEIVVAEFSKMQHLKVLNLFNNPVAQEQEYRVYVVHHVPSVQLFDRHEVLKNERDQGRRLYDQVKEHVKDSIAFSRRSEGPPALYYPRDQAGLTPTDPGDVEIGNNFYRDNPPYATEEQAVNMRALRRSVMEFSHFDWSKAPRAQQRRLNENQTITPQIITTRFR